MRDLLAIGVVVLLVLIALSMATTLRWRYRDRERSRRQLNDQGRRVIAEVPVADSMEFFSEDAEAFYWAGQTIQKRAVHTARLLISGAPLATVRSRQAPDFEAADAAAGKDADPIERERWDVSIETSRRDACLWRAARSASRSPRTWPAASSTRSGARSKRTTRAQPQVDEGRRAPDGRPQARTEGLGKRGAGQRGPR